MILVTNFHCVAKQIGKNLKFWKENTCPIHRCQGLHDDESYMQRQENLGAYLCYEILKANFRGLHKTYLKEI